MAGKKFRIAVVGAGIGERHVVAFDRLADKFEIAAICDLDEGRARALAASVRNGPAPEVHGAFDDALLARTDIDVIDICTPPVTHVGLVRRALEAGRHVICEKPVFGSLADADAMTALAERAGRTLMPVFQYRFGGGLAKAKQLMKVAGKVYLSSVETHWTRGADYYAVKWRGKHASELGGVFLGHALHIHDMLTYLVGEVRTVQALTATRVNDIETEDCAGALLGMADGSVAVTSATLGSADEISRLRIVCENVTMTSNLSAYVPGRDPWTFVPKAPKDGAWLDAALADAPAVSEGYTGQFELFHASLATGAPPPITMVDGRRSIELASAIYHAARTGERVDLPMGADHPAHRGWL